MKKTHLQGVTDVRQYVIHFLNVYVYGFKVSGFKCMSLGGKVKHCGHVTSIVIWLTVERLLTLLSSFAQPVCLHSTCKLL